MHTLLGLPSSSSELFVGTVILQVLVRAAPPEQRSGVLEHAGFGAVLCRALSADEADGHDIRLVVMRVLMLDMPDASVAHLASGLADAPLLPVYLEVRAGLGDATYVGCTSKQTQGHWLCRPAMQQCMTAPCLQMLDLYSSCANHWALQHVLQSARRLCTASRSVLKQFQRRAWVSAVSALLPCASAAVRVQAMASIHWMTRQQGQGAVLLSDIARTARVHNAGAARCRRRTELTGCARRRTG